MKKINKISSFLFVLFSGMDVIVYAASEGAAVSPDAGPASHISLGELVVIILIIAGLAKLFGKGSHRANEKLKIKPEYVPKVRTLVDKISAYSRCINGQGLSWSRAYGDWKSNDQLVRSNGAVNLNDILNQDDLAHAKELGFDQEMITNAAQAFCFHAINRQVGQDTWCDEVSTLIGDNAVDSLCDNKSILSSYLLYRIATAKPITIKMSACLGWTDYTFDFKKRSEKARQELEKRGFGGRDPLETIAQ